MGLLLGAALIAGRVARIFHLPQVTAYLLVGLALGPHTPLAGFADWVAQQFDVTLSLVGWHVPEAHLEYLEPVSKFAIALVLFNMGCHFSVAHFRRLFKRLLPMSLGELITTMVLVTGGLLLLDQVHPKADITWQLAVLFGALALATAPATTVMVLKENHSEGPLTEFATGLVALNNLASIVIFELLFVLVHATAGEGISICAEFLGLAANLGTALALGITAGLATSFFCGIFSSTRWLVLLIAVIAPLMAVCELTQVSFLLTFLTMGTVVASTSNVADKISESLDRFTGLLCVVFFVIHGAAMDLANLWTVGAVGISYIALRSAGKYFGVFFTANAHRDGPPVKRWLGAAMFSQAGAAIALSAIAVNRDPELGQRLQEIILGTVVFFEIVGPIFVRTAVLQAGEVPVADAILHTTNTPLEQLRGMLFRIMKSFGFNPLRGNSADKLDVSRVTARSVKALQAGAMFEEVLDHIEHSHDNTYPVVGEGNKLIGVIRYTDVRDVLFEPTVNSLVTAEDLAVPVKKVLKQDETLGEAWKLLKDGRNDCVPIVTTTAPHQYVGVVRRRDLLRLLSLDASQESIVAEE